MSDAVEYVAGLIPAEESDAAQLIREVWNFATVWDDAVDGDKRQDEDDVNRAFEFALFSLHDNDFLRRHPELLLVLKLCALNWKCANELQRAGTPDAVATAYALRCSPYDFFVAVVLLAAGPEAAEKAVAYLRGAPDIDSFDSFYREHLRA